jgi:hypothetical protein
MTNRLRSLASRVITSWARPSAGPPGILVSTDWSTKGITATEARRGAGTTTAASLLPDAVAGGEAAT